MNQESSSDWKLNPWAVGLLVVVFFPYGLYLVWKNPFWQTKTKWIVTGAYFACVVLGRIISEGEKAQLAAHTNSRNAVIGSGHSSIVAVDGAIEIKAEYPSSTVATSGKGKKVAAFKEVVTGWEQYEESVGDDTTKKRWLQNMQQVQERFIEIPFDPKADLDSMKEAKQLLEMFTQRLRGTTETMKAYYETGNEFEAANELALWKKLTKHLEKLFNSK